TESIPPIERDSLIASIRDTFPAVVIQTAESEDNLNLAYRSWRIEVRYNDNRVDISWGPLAGLWGTCVFDGREQRDPFAPYHMPLESIDNVMSFIKWCCILGDGLER